MTKRIPVSTIQNKFFDSEQIDSDDLSVEQNYNNTIQSGLLNNHIGSGVLLETLDTNILFDSSLASGLLDGYAISAQSQPTDKNFGNQLEIELIGSAAAGKRTVKVAIIGLDFQGNLQYDTFTFKTNEKQYTKKHYTNIATILINDLKGVSTQSFNLGGQLLIKEAAPFTLSRDPIMVSQDVEPNLFFRDFYATGFASLTPLLQSALPLYNIDSLNIKIGFKENQILAANDVTTQIGQKFQATTNNIQKISLLLSVQNTTPPGTDLAWHGDLVVSIYPLQTAVDCPTDIVPNTAIEFSPSNIPIAQVSFNYNTLQAVGVQLDGNPQPVDFIFSNTSVANGTTIVPGAFYAITVKRSGSADKCDILIAAGSNSDPSIARTTIFTGNLWVDITEDNLWYRVFTDSAKVTDGQAYESGHGIIIPKTIQDPLTNAQEDYNLSAIQFTGNGLNTAVVQAITENSDPIQDQRTGNPVFSRQEYVPSIQLLNPIDMTNLEAVTEPFTIGVIQDTNQKTFDVSTATLSAAIHSWSFIKNQLVIKLITDTSDPRYDANVLSLLTNFVNGDLTDAKLIPNTSNPNQYYRIANATLCTMIYGDVNGDGLIDDDDISALNKLQGANLNLSPPVNSQITTDSINTTVVNGYSTLINPFVTDFGVTFQLVDPISTNVIASGSDGVVTPNPNDNSLAAFGSASTDFSAVPNLTNLDLVIYGSSNQANDGYFTILNVDISSIHAIDIQKLYIDTDIVKQIFRADIDDDLSITTNDGYLLQSYINKTIPFPPISLPSLRIGTTFETLTLTIDPFLYMDTAQTLIDRTDDFPYNQTNRNTSLHIIQDFFLNDGYLENHNFLTSPVALSIVKQLNWEEYQLAAIGQARPVPAVFTSDTGDTSFACENDGIICETYPTGLTYDPGKIDYFIPNNLIMGEQLLNKDGYFYKIDFEVGNVVLEIPTGLLNQEYSINLYDTFVSDYNATGRTRIGFPAMRYADCSTVQPNDIFHNRIRFDVSMQSFSPQLDGYTFDGYGGDILDDKEGVFIDQSTGIMRINFTNLYQDPVLQTLITKVQVNVFLKKGGFNNNPLIVSSDKVLNILNLMH